MRYMEKCNRIYTIDFSFDNIKMSKILSFTDFNASSALACMLAPFSINSSTI